jgi:altronate hydrolase
MKYLLVFQRDQSEKLVHGNVISPTIKVCANPQIYRNMREDMDFNAGAALEVK